MKLRPLYHRITVKRKAEETTSAGGIVLTPNAVEKPLEGVVVAVGPGKSMPDGTIQSMDLKPGDTVIFVEKSGTEVTIGGEDLIVLTEEDIMCIIS